MRSIVYVCALFLIIGSSWAQNACSTERIPTYLSNAGFGWVRDIVWASNDMQDVYVRADGNLIFHSTNGGDIFFPIMDDFPDFYTEFGQHNYGVITLQKGAADGLVYFQGATRKNYWKTVGDGEFTEYQSGEDFYINVQAHPQDANLVLRLVAKCISDDNCYTQLEISEYQGAPDSFRVIRQYVYSYSWGNSENEIYMISLPEEYMTGDFTDAEKADMRFYVTTDLGRNFQHVSDAGVYQFDLQDEIIYLVKYNEAKDSSEMLISTNSGESFMSATYEGVSSISSIDSAIYEIVDSSEGISFLTICSTGRYETLATLFQANLEDARFWVNIPNLRATCNPFDWHGIDFQQIKSLPGTYFANTFAREAFESTDEDIEEYIQSVFTFDKGGSWSQLPPPEGSDCTGSDCHLHLFSGANFKTPTDVQSIYSTSAASGIVIATGNVGEYRRPMNESNTYISRNGGYSWELLREGLYTYCMASQGSLLIMVPLNQTNEMFYSWDQGLTWDSCFFTHDLVKVNLILDISSQGKDPSLRFMFVGIAEEGGFMMTSSFTQNQPRECQGVNQPGYGNSDFELFIPEGAGSCLLGEQVAYTRRRRDAVCVSRYEEVSTTIGSCSCTREDFTCAGGCWQQGVGKQGEIICVNTCAGQPNDPTLPPANCQGTYQVPSGYRLVTGDKCIGGEQLDAPQTYTCP